MITFANIKLTSVDLICPEFEIISDKNINLQRLGELMNKRGNLAIKYNRGTFKITNKGGHRLINFFKSLESFKAENLYVFYNPDEISYQLKTIPEKLSNYSEYGYSPIFEVLKDNRIVLSILKEGSLNPYKFDSNTSLFEWILSKDSALCAKVFNQIQDLKAKENLSKKDLQFFSDNLDSVSIIESRYGLNKIDVIKAFLKYTI